MQLQTDFMRKNNIEPIDIDVPRHISVYAKVKNKDAEKLRNEIETLLMDIGMPTKVTLTYQAPMEKEYEIEVK